jgi:hypothetical protein
MLTIWEYNAKNNAKKLHCFSHYLTDPTILAYRITVSLGQKKKCAAEVAPWPVKSTKVALSPCDEPRAHWHLHRGSAMDQ